MAFLSNAGDSIKAEELLAVFFKHPAEATAAMQHWARDNLPADILLSADAVM